MFQIQVCMLQGSVTNIKVIFIMFAGPQFLVWLGLLCGDCFSVNGLLCAQWYLIAWAESLSLECLALVQYIWLCFQFSDFINWIWKTHLIEIFNFIYKISSDSFCGILIKHRKGNLFLVLLPGDSFWINIIYLVCNISVSICKLDFVFCY